MIARGFRVTGIELVESAVQQFFQERGLQPTITEQPPFKLYAYERINIWVGDFFQMTADILGPIDAIYDRAALVALPEQMRRDYVKQLLNITGSARQLAIYLEYEPGLMEGPPFTVVDQEVREHYHSIYHLTCLDRQPMEGGLKKVAEVQETIWLLEPLDDRSEVL